MSLDLVNSKIYNELKGEIFKDIFNYEGLYQVSNFGRVRSLDRVVKRSGFDKRLNGTIMTISVGMYGYIKVTFHKNGKSKCFQVHRLVADAFLPNPNNYPIINHIDENKSNNNVNNLEWCTTLYNNTYGNRINKMVDKIASSIVQLSVEGDFIADWKNISEVGRQYDVESASIIGCCKGEYKTAAGYKWMYSDDYYRDKEITKIKYHFKNKPFVQLGKNNILIREWYSLSQMHKETGFSISSVSLYLNDKEDYAYGYNWVYLNEYYENFSDDNKEYSNSIGHDHLMKIASTKKKMI